MLSVVIGTAPEFVKACETLEFISRKHEKDTEIAKVVSDFGNTGNWKKRKKEKEIITKARKYENTKRI
jgi:hypothetical protein